jgi:hypothetical protein
MAIVGPDPECFAYYSILYMLRRALVEDFVDSSIKNISSPHQRSSIAVIDELVIVLIREGTWIRSLFVPKETPVHLATTRHNKYGKSIEGQPGYLRTARTYSANLFTTFKNAHSTNMLSV